MNRMYTNLKGYLAGILKLFELISNTHFCHYTYIIYVGTLIMKVLICTNCY